jgi:membrane dipeptidase
MTMNARDARQLHDEVPVIDLHADTPKLMASLGYNLAARHDRPLPRFANYFGHVDLPRMREGGLSAQIFGLWTFPYPERGCAASVHKQLNAVDAAATELADQFALGGTPAAIRAGQAQGKVVAMTGIEGGQALEGQIENVERFARRGVRYIGLLHFSPNALGWPAKNYARRVPGAGRGPSAHPDDGLTPFGREVVCEMNRLGIIIDLAHINRRGFFDALEESDAPVMVSHTGVSGVHQHWRNIDDEQLRAVAEGGGCVGVIFAPRFLGGRGLDAVCDHVLHVVDVAGEDTPALGSDFDGFVAPPRGLEDVSKLPELTAALSARGLSRTTLAKILGGNALRVLGAVPPIIEDSGPR